MTKQPTQAAPKLDAQPDDAPLNKGDYVLATKWGDGDPQEHWCVGFFNGILVDHKGQETERYMVIDNEGKPFRGGGFRRAERISKERGAWLLERARAIEESGQSLWEWLEAPMGAQPDDAPDKLAQARERKDFRLEFSEAVAEYDGELCQMAPGDNGEYPDLSNEGLGHLTDIAEATAEPLFERIRELEAQLEAWNEAALRYYPANFACDMTNPASVIVNIVGPVTDARIRELESQLAEAQRLLESARTECGEWRRRRDQAVIRAEEAEQREDETEARFAAIDAALDDADAPEATEAHALDDDPIIERIKLWRHVDSEITARLAEARARAETAERRAEDADFNSACEIKEKMQLRKALEAVVTYFAADESGPIYSLWANGDICSWDDNPRERWTDVLADLADDKLSTLDIGHGVEWEAVTLYRAVLSALSPRGEGEE